MKHNQVRKSESQVAVTMKMIITINWRLKNSKRKWKINDSEKISDY